MTIGASVKWLLRPLDGKRDFQLPDFVSGDEDGYVLRKEENEMTMQNLNGEAKNPIASERLGHTDGATLRIDPGAGSSPVCPAETPLGDVLTLERLEPHADEGVRFEVTRKDWLAIARIIAVDNRVDARVVSRMFDPQVGEEFGSEVTEDLDIALLLILEWLDRIRAEPESTGVEQSRSRSSRKFPPGHGDRRELEPVTSAPGAKEPFKPALG